MELTGTVTDQSIVAYDESEFEKLFKLHFKALHAYAAVMLQDETVAEEIVQTMFLKLWEKRDRLVVDTSIKAYLYKCVHNDSLNYIKHLKVREKNEDQTS